MRKPYLLLATGVLAACLAPSALAVRVYVRVGPPPVKVEVRGVAPSPNHVWIGGYHRWDGNVHVWVPGRWEAAPRPRAAWVPGHWKHTRQGWYWVDGHWK